MGHVIKSSTLPPRFSVEEPGYEANGSMCVQKKLCCHTLATQDMKCLVLVETLYNITALCAVTELVHLKQHLQVTLSQSRYSQ